MVVITLLVIFRSVVALGTSSTRATSSVTLPLSRRASRLAFLIWEAAFSRTMPGSSPSSAMEVRIAISFSTVQREAAHARLTAFESKKERAVSEDSSSSRGMISIDELSLWAIVPSEPIGRKSTHLLGCPLLSYLHEVCQVGGIQVFDYDGVLLWARLLRERFGVCGDLPHDVGSKRLEGGYVGLGLVFVEGSTLDGGLPLGGDHPGLDEVGKIQVSERTTDPRGHDDVPGVDLLAHSHFTVGSWSRHKSMSHRVLHNS